MQTTPLRLRRQARTLLAIAGLGLAALVALVALSSAPAAARAPAPAHAESVTLKLMLDRPITGLNSPVGLTHAGDARLFVVEQGGLIRIVQNGSVLPTPFLDVHTLISTGSERGLLGLAFPPNYAQYGFFYIYYTDVSGNPTLARYARSPSDPNVADPGSGVVLLNIPHPTYANHNGGQLAFGPDGYLYLGPGDGGGGGDPSGNAQNRDVLLGKLLRIDVGTPGPAPYAVPTTNPFYGQANTRWEIWDWGLRNPWRFSFDRQTGDLYIGDVGQNAWEEVDFEPAGSAGGNNYGWNLWEGRHCYDPPSNCTPTPGATPFYPWVTPVAEYDHSLGCAITGGYSYRGVQSPGMLGTYFFSDYCSGRIWGLSRPGGQWTMTSLLDPTGHNITSFGQDLGGELYITSYEGVYHLRQASAFLPVVLGSTP